ncbi:MAG: YdjY domain-containing protein [Planctomycetota bacterium]
MRIGARGAAWAGLTGTAAITLAVSGAGAGPVAQAVAQTNTTGVVPAGEPGPQAESETQDGAAAFPFIRIDAEQRVVDVEGVVAVDAHHPDTPRVYLELIACSPDSREHESLVVTQAKPSHLHAALLLIGLEPGTPGSWRTVGDAVERIAPQGDTVVVEILTNPGTSQERATPIESWVVNAEDGAVFFDGRWVFAGSRFITVGSGDESREVYEADAAGTIVGLTTFGSEVIAWSGVISHLAGVDEPEWIANAEAMPNRGEAVVLRFRAPSDDADGTSE